MVQGQTVIEVKNVSYQHLSTQIKDYAAYAKANNMTFELVMRDGGRFSPALDAFMKGENMVLTWMKFSTTSSWYWLTCVIMA